MARAGYFKRRRLAAEAAVPRHRCERAGCSAFTRIRTGGPGPFRSRNRFCQKHASTPEQRSARARRWRSTKPLDAKTARELSAAAWLAALRWHLKQHPRDADVMVLVDDLARALASPTRPVSNIVRTLDEDPRLRHIRGSWRMRAGQSYSATTRFNQSVGQTYRFVAARRHLPRLQHLLAPGHEGRPVKYGLPDPFRTRWGFVVLCAVVRQLRDGGESPTQIALRFGFRVARREAPMVTALLEVATTLSHKTARAYPLVRTRWPRAVVEAAAYIRGLP